MNSAELSIPLINPAQLAPPAWTMRSVFSSGDMAMDLGTANTLIYLRNRGVVLNEPSVVALDEQSKEVLAVGHGAKEVFGKTGRNVRCVRPMKDGVIADFEMTALMIRYMISKVRRKLCLRKPQIIIGVPSGITQVEKKAVIDAAMCAGVSAVRLMEEPMAAAVGAGLPVDQAVGNMIIDIGGGTTEVAIICLSGTVYSHSIRVAGDEMDEAIQRHLRRAYSLEIGIFEAERLKLVLGSALPFSKKFSVVTSGRDLTSGMPRKMEVTDQMVREALQEPISAIIASVVTALEQTKPEIAQDIISRGIYVAGGGALLKGLCERLHRETGIKFLRATDPLCCVVRGVGTVLDNFKAMKALCIA